MHYERLNVHTEYLVFTSKSLLLSNVHFSVNMQNTFRTRWHFCMYVNKWRMYVLYINL